MTTAIGEEKYNRDTCQSGRELHRRNSHIFCECISRSVTLWTYRCHSNWNRYINWIVPGPDSIRLLSRVFHHRLFNISQWTERVILLNENSLADEFCEFHAKYHSKKWLATPPYRESQRKGPNEACRFFYSWHMHTDQIFLKYLTANVGGYAVASHQKHGN